ncbi:APC membrane recruitment protein 2 [Hyaena hyaena]|uniref:APC membrane recruitment protein 2 n=1 Tax=Hyaena hyaena TaxID=95912 RepID=UPI001923D071|nr:APC membrane recruitment protein 2 [Hyaena hyaena]
MATRGRGGGGGGAVSERGGGGGGGDRASAGVCGRKAEAGAGALAADMDSPCDCAAETPAAEQPSGKINKAAFKLFKKRKSGGTMPSIFGVKHKGDGKGSGPTGMVRSRTHDGLAEVLVLEGGKKEEPRGGGGGGGGGVRPSPGAPRAGGSAAPSAVAKSHSFFSLLKKNGRPEGGGGGGRGEPADASKAGGKQKRGLKGLFSSMRWHRKDKRAKAEAKGERAGAPGGRVPPGSLTASLECVKEETAAPARQPEQPSGDAPPEPAGCGDIIADPEDEAGPSCDKHAPGPGRQKPGGVLAYQGGGEEMASPEGLDDTCLQEFWDMLSRAEDPAPGPPAAAAPGPQAAPETAADAPSGKPRRLPRSPAEPRPGEEPEAVAGRDDSRRGAATPGPEDASGAEQAAVPRDAPGGDAPCDPDAEPDAAAPAAAPAGEEASCPSRLKPVSPGAITCPLRTPGSLLRDSKIPISIKHLANLPSSHPAAPQPPVRSEMPRTKIPVSKVLVRRVSSRALAGTAMRAAACHDGAKKL